VPQAAPDGRVAVVVATRDRVDSLAVALRHLLALPERPRVVVVDNGSADGTPEVVRGRFPQVEVVELGTDHGAAARTAGARRCAEPYVAFADDDSWFAPAALARAADLLDAHPRLALIAGRVLVGPEARPDPVCELMARSPLASAGDLPGPPVLGFVACGAVVRREAFLAVGGFERRLGIGGEEELLAVDLASAGWDLCYVDSVIAHHHPSPSRDPARRRRTQVRNRLWCAWLRRPPASALRATASTLRPALTDRDARAGVLAALRGAPWAIRHRRAVPLEVERSIRTLERSAA
jgi:GT2 family glycosyltransferase